MRICSLASAQALLASMCVAFSGAILAEVPADVITVGNGGVAANCTTDTIQAAINIAQQRAGASRIWVSRDTGDPNSTNDDYYVASSALDINDPNDLEIVGGFDNCNDVTPAGFTDISGSGNERDPVFRIRTNAKVQLAHLGVSLGDADLNEGSGIDYAGNGELRLLSMLIRNNAETSQTIGGGIRFVGGPQAQLTIIDSEIRENKATFGGGLAFLGHGTLTVHSTRIQSNIAVRSGGGLFLSGAPIIAKLEHAVSIRDNRAVSEDGGGLYSAGTVLVEWNGADARMWANEAGDAGGGFYMEQLGSVADLSPRGPLVNGEYASVFYANTAKRGGALAAMSSAIYLSSRDGNSAQILSFNEATEQGGALFLGAEGTVGLLDTSLFDNSAPRGAAIYGEGANLYINTNHRNPNAAKCANSSLHCSDFAGNIASLGRVIEIEGRNGPSVLSALIDKARFFQNQGQQLISLENNSHFRLADSIVDANLTSSYLINISNPAAADILNNTIVNNQIGETAVIHATEIVGEDLIAANIFAQPGKRSLSNPQAILSTRVYENLSNDSVMVAINWTNLIGEPIFQSGKALYELHPGSPGVDYTTRRAERRDFHSRPYVDLPNVVNGAGGYGDVGAKEIQEASSLFSSGFED